MQADSGKLSDSESPVLRSSEEEINDEDFLGHVPDSSRSVPEIASPPTASGLYWHRNPQYTSSYEHGTFVPDMSISQMGQHNHGQSNFTLSKRVRQ